MSVTTKINYVIMVQLLTIINYFKNLSRLLTITNFENVHFFPEMYTLGIGFRNTKLHNTLESRRCEIIIVARLSNEI